MASAISVTWNSSKQSSHAFFGDAGGNRHDRIVALDFAVA
jgi:hypothetical protein